MSLKTSQPATLAGNIIRALIFPQTLLSNAPAPTMKPIRSVDYSGSVKRDWFADLLVAQTFQNKFSVRAKTFHKTSFCCKNSLRSEINPYHFESPLSGEFFNFIFLQEKDGWQMSPLSTSFPTHWHLIECFSVVLFHFHQNAKEKVNVSVGSINPN